MTRKEAQEIAEADLTFLQWIRRGLDMFFKAELKVNCWEHIDSIPGTEREGIITFRGKTYFVQIEELKGWTEKR